MDNQPENFDVLAKQFLNGISGSLSWAVSLIINEHLPEDKIDDFIKFIDRLILEGVFKFYHNNSRPGGPGGGDILDDIGKDIASSFKDGSVYAGKYYSKEHINIKTVFAEDGTIETHMNAKFAAKLKSKLSELMAIKSKFPDVTVRDFISDRTKAFSLMFSIASVMECTLEEAKDLFIFIAS